ncbi:MAG: nicotinamide riboside transporter PnuC [Prevotellaceae bacterium]|jgi:nicotinamide mononucleotide transporter|nr:nicotinamide riboside transporter PnuC [Prevotellaceae bacterium]
MDSSLFEILGYSVSSALLIEALAVLLTFLCILAAVREKILTFPLGMTATAIYFYIFFIQHVYSSMILQAVFFVFNAYGLYRWTHPASGRANSENRLAVTLCSRRQRMICVLSVIIITVTWGYISGRLHIWIPALFTEPAEYANIDAFILAASLVGQYLMAIKKLENWIFWFTVDIVAAPFYTITVGWFTGTLYLVFIFTAISGFFNWKKNLRLDD